MAKRGYRFRKYVENCEIVVEIGKITAGIQDRWFPGARFPITLPSGLPALITCRPDTAYLVIGDQEWRLDYCPMPQRPGQKKHYLQPLIVDNSGHRVRKLYWDGKAIGSKYDLNLHYRAEGQTKAKREQWRREKILAPISQWKHAEILDVTKDVKKLVFLKPERMKRFAFLNLMIKARFGSVKQGTHEQLQSELTHTITEYFAYCDRHRRYNGCPPWLISYQIQPRDDSLPIIGFHSTG
jgi:hypothetical protein